MGKKFIIILSVTILIVSCLNKVEEIKSTSDLNKDETTTKKLEILIGLYTDDTNTLEILQQNGDSMVVDLSISNQNCAMPNYRGTLNRRTINEFEGLVISSLDDENELHHLKVSIHNSLIKVMTNDSWENWQLGATCWIEGEYLKTKSD